MTDRLVLASEFFNIAGERRQDNADTFRVLPTLQTHSGDRVGFYAVTEASVAGPMGSRARRLVVDVIQGEFVSRFDLPPGARLKAGVQAAHADLLAEFDGHVRVGVTVLVAQDSSLYLLQVPPAQAYVLHDGGLHSINVGGPVEASAFGQALGSPDLPFISLFRDTIDPMDAIALCSSWFANDLAADELRAAFVDASTDVIANRLFQKARAQKARDVTAVTLQAISDDEVIEDAATQPSVNDDVGGSIWDRIDEAATSLTYVWQRARNELRPAGSRSSLPKSTAARSSTEPVTSQPPPGFGPDAIATAEEDTLSADNPPPVTLDDMQLRNSTDDYAEPGTDELPIIDVAWDPVSDRFDDRTPVSDAGDRRTTRPSSDSPSGRSADLDEVNSFIQSTIELGPVSPPVQGFSDMNIAPERIYPGSKGETMARKRRWGVPRTATKSSRTADNKAAIFQPRLRGINISRQRATLSSVPAAIWLWSLVGVGLLVIIIVAVSLSSGSSAIDYPAKADARANNAVADFRQHKPAASSVQLGYAYIDISQARKHHFSPQLVAATVRYVQTRANLIHAVAPGLAKVVARFHQRNVDPTQLVTGDPNIYIVDTLGQRFFAIDPGGTNRAPQVVANTGDAPNNLRFNDPKALLSNGNEMVAIDERFTVLAYIPGQAVATESLVAPAPSTHVVAATSYATNLYFLDKVAGQIWKYFGMGNGLYAPTPQGYIAVPSPRLFRKAVSVAITHDNVYVGLRNGHLLEYHNHVRVPFAIHLPIKLKHMTQVYGRQDLRYLYLVDRSAGRIVEITLAGRYVRTVVVPHTLVAGLKEISLSGNGRVIYFASGRTVYSIPAS